MKLNVLKRVGPEPINSTVPLNDTNVTSCSLSMDWEKSNENKSS